MVYIFVHTYTYWYTYTFSEDDCLADKVSLLPPLGDSK